MLNKILNLSWPGPSSRRHKPDYSLALSALVLLIIGLVIQYAIGPAITARDSLASSYYFNRHLISLVFGLLGFYLAWKIPIKKWLDWAVAITAISMFLAIVALIIGGSGSRWIQINFFSFQPVEVIKIGVILWAALFLSNARKQESYFHKWQSIKPLMIVLTAVTLVVVVLQRDLGSMAVIAASLIAMIWASGFSLRLFLVLTVVTVALTSLFIVSTPYRRQRLTTYFNPSADCQDEGYQVCQALIGVGSGGLLGRGVGQSVQVYGYLPEANNDSVFAIYAEIIGFIGVMVYFAITYKLYQSMFMVAKRSADDVLMFISIGVLIWFSFQSIINIGAMVGLLPLKGITLPFISYGGSSLMMVMFATGLLLQISSYTVYGERHEKTSSYNTSRRRVRRSRYTSASSRV